MKRFIVQGLVLTAVAGGGIAIGLSLDRFGVGPRSAPKVEITSPATAALPSERKVLYYQDPLLSPDLHRAECAIVRSSKFRYSLHPSTNRQATSRANRTRRFSVSAPPCARKSANATSAAAHG